MLKVEEITVLQQSWKQNLNQHYLSNTGAKTSHFFLCYIMHNLYTTTTKQRGLFLETGMYGADTYLWPQ